MKKEIIDSIVFLAKGFVGGLAILGASNLYDSLTRKDTVSFSYSPGIEILTPVAYEKHIFIRVDDLSPPTVDEPEFIDKDKIKECSSDKQCTKLAEAVFFESRGESKEGQYAVAHVIVNRRDNEGRWGYTIKDVVNQRSGNVCQFEYMCVLSNQEMRDMILDEPESWERSLIVAYEVFNQESEDLTNGADHFYNPDSVSKTPKFAKVYDYVAYIDNHKFFRSN